MMRPAEYMSFDAVALGELIAKGEITSEELITCCETIVDQLDGRVNAVVSRHFDDARRQSTPAPDFAPFFGVPFGAKEEGAYYRGIPSGASSRLLPPTDPEYDTNFVTKYKRAGLRLVAKLNMPELAASITTESAVNGICRNPWNPERSTGGSSGGPAAAVAAGYFPAAYANDGAGSIRIPASCCGVFGLKPSRGRVAKGPYLLDEWSGNVSDHVITRTVRDSAAILDISAGMDVGAPYDAPYSPGNFIDHVGRLDRPLKIGLFTRSPTGAPVHPDCQEAAEDAAKLCEDLGHSIEFAQPDLDGDELFERLLDLMSANLAMEVSRAFRLSDIDPHPDYVEPTNYALFQRGSRISAIDYLENLRSLGHLARRASAFFEDFDLFLSPTLAKPNLGHGEVTPAMHDLSRFWDGWKHFIPFTPLANIAGHPAMSVPLYWTADNMPVGAHFQGRIGSEAMLFGLAGQLEQARAWVGKTPPISAKSL
ncbi:amidase [Pacificimonas sp. WHA3]|uniref:Amidase n=1 Tax=Pacificimonas pallii TaxID=2827236 RepID=A0ABS6SAC3_9SPHN|nr:amidase [Pacificimonas pallii]MBV7255280.1 amidase [Pacificimonas pallii]